MASQQQDFFLHYTIYIMQPSVFGFVVSLLVAGSGEQLAQDNKNK